MSIQAWADQEHLAESLAKCRHVNEIKHMINVFRSLLEGHLSAGAAARSISAAFEPLFQDDYNPEDYQILFPWALVASAAQAIGDSEELSFRLIALMDAFSEITCTDRCGQPVKIGGGILWREYPSFAWMFRDHAMSITSAEVLDCDWTEWWAQATPYLNATSFAARWLDKRGTRTGMHFYTEESFRLGIEYGPKDDEDTQQIMLYVPPAATWIILAGKAIFQLCRKDFHRRSQSGRVVHLWKGDIGFSIDRWVFWSRRFSEIATMEGFPRHVTEISLRAMAVMQDIQDQDLK